MYMAVQSNKWKKVKGWDSKFGSLFSHSLLIIFIDNVNVFEEYN